jgi:thioesterase domain-containing protein
MADAPYPFLESPESLTERIQKIWHDKIPLTRQMGVSIASLDEDGLRLTAPLAPNVNHMGTGFGGSLASVATLTGWGLTQVLSSHIEDVHVVVRESRLKYRATVTEDFETFCAFPAPEVIDAFRAQIDRRNRARLQLQVQLTAGGRSCLELDGDFAAFVGE